MSCWRDRSFKYPSPSIRSRSGDCDRRAWSDGPNLRRLNVEQQRVIRRAGLLHDIGKLGVSNLVLDKPGKLTDHEYAQMKTHTVYTQSILERVSCFNRFANYASAHHERLDGRGYHLGLAGDDVPLEARILAVADVTEALAAKRPYRDGMPAERIIGILKSDSGTAFDHDCVQALIQFADKQSLFSQLAAQNEALNELAESTASD